MISPKTALILVVGLNYHRVWINSHQQGSPMDRPPGGSGGNLGGGSSGSMDNPTSKKIPFLYHSHHSE